MTHFQKSDLVVDGVRVQVLETGKGKPLVYFHGAGTEASVVRFTPANRSASGSSSSKPPLARKPNTVVIRRAGYGALGRLDRVQGVRFLRLTCRAADGPAQPEMTPSRHGAQGAAHRRNATRDANEYLRLTESNSAFRLRRSIF